MDRKSKVMLTSGLLLAVSGAMLAAPAGWESLLTPHVVGGMLASFAGALMTAYGVKTP